MIIPTEIAGISSALAAKPEVFKTITRKLTTLREPGNPELQDSSNVQA